MKKFLFLLMMIGFIGKTYAQQYKVASPDGKLTAVVNTGEHITLSIQQNGQAVINAAELGLQLQGEDAPGGKARASKSKEVNETITETVPLKASKIDNHYKELTLRFGKHYQLIVRAYNDAISYRWNLDFKDSVIVKNEICDFQLPSGSNAFFQYTDRWVNSYEHLYSYKPVDSLAADQTTQLPLLMDLPGNAPKVLFTEADLEDYPGFYFRGNNDNSLHAIFPPAAKTVKHPEKGEGGWDRNYFPDETYDYIAKTSGSRSLPWRIFAIANNDGQLLDNSIVYKLSKPDQLTDNSWIKPGQVAWDWWNHWNVTHVDFRAGVNTETYKYYIDFAAKNNIPYIIMDEGWYELGDLTKLSSNLDLKEIINYGKQKNVGVILWCVWKTLDMQMKEVMDNFQKWGVAGIKVDFMDRDDQDVVNFYWRCAKMAAEHHLLVDYHGAHKPAGILRTYPNVVNFEGVPGLEQDKWTGELATPEMAVTLPFIRMFSGPMDYTPGAMRNAQKKDFRPVNDNPMSVGTRCQQLAMYVVYVAPLQMLADNPTAYEENKESLDFITSVPTTWDETVPLDSKVGDYIAVARRKGNKWFVGAMTDWTPRDLSLDFSFLPQGQYKITIFQDGINADRNATDYKKVEKTIASGDKLNIHLAPGGGWAARIEPQ